MYLIRDNLCQAFLKSVERFHNTNLSTYVTCTWCDVIFPKTLMTSPICLPYYLWLWWLALQNAFHILQVLFLLVSVYESPVIVSYLHLFHFLIQLQTSWFFQLLVFWKEVLEVWWIGNGNHKKSPQKTQGCSRFLRSGYTETPMLAWTSTMNFIVAFFTIIAPLYQ